MDEANDDTDVIFRVSYSSLCSIGGKGRGSMRCGTMAGDRKQSLYMPIYRRTKHTYICMYVSMYVYKYVHMYIYIYTHTSTDTLTNIVQIYESFRK